MSRQKLNVEDVAKWITVNSRRVKNLRLLTDTDIARRSEIHRVTIRYLMTNNWQGNRTIRWMMFTLRRLVALCNALEITPAELFSRPDDMTITDGRKTRWETTRRKQQLQQSEEQRERQALLESLGLAE